MRKVRYLLLSIALTVSMILSNGFCVYAEEPLVPLDEPMPPEAPVLQEETITLPEEPLPLEEPISPVEEPILPVEEPLVPMEEQFPPVEPITPPEEIVIPPEEPMTPPEEPITPPEELIIPPEEPITPIEELLPAVEVIPPPPPEPIIVPRNLGLTAELRPDSDTWTNGETITYSVFLTNDGTEPLSGVSVHDDWGIDGSLSLQAGETQTIKGEYKIDVYNKYEVLGNSIEINADFEGVSQSIDLGFNVNIEIPRGSITITNNSDPGMPSSEFDFLIDGPNGTKYSISLEPGEKGIIEGLYIGNYSLSTIAPMNYEEIVGSGRVELTLDHLDEEIVVEYRVINQAWFTDQSMGVVSDSSITLMDITRGDIDLSVSENRSESVYIELEPIVIMPEIVPLPPAPEILAPVIEDATITPNEQMEALPPDEPEPTHLEVLEVPKEPEIPEILDESEAGQ